MYSDDKKLDTTHVYEVLPSVEATQPKARRPLWRRVLAVFLIISTILMLRSTFVPYCSRSYEKEVIIPVHSSDPERPEQPIRRMRFTFPDKLENFAIKQVSQTLLPTRAEIYGKIHIGSSSRAKNITVFVAVKSSDTSNFDKLKFEQKEWGLEFSADFTAITKQWVNITAFVLVPAHEHYKLQRFVAETHELGIALRPTFKSNVNMTRLQSVTGSIVSYGDEARDVLHARHLYAKSESGNIWGRFGLGKDVVLETKTGEIGVNITNPPSYITNSTAHISTTTVSGNNKIQFATHLHHRTLHSDHKSVSGWLRIGYPTDWTGTLDMKSVTGHLKLIGQGTKIVKKRKGLEGRFYKAIKGNGDDKAHLATVSGDINVGIGEYLESPGGGHHHHDGNSAPTEEELDCGCDDEDEE